MGFLSDLKRKIGRGLRSDVGKAAILGGLGAYGFAPGLLSSSMMKNMARRYATSYLTNRALGRPHSHKGALSAALWSLPFQAWKNYGLTQPLMGGADGTKVLREGTDTPWWKLMTGQGEAGDPELGFMDMFTKDKPIYGEGEAEGLGKILGLGRGPVEGYKKGLDPLAFAPEVMGYGAADFTPEEKWDAAKKRTEMEQEHMNKLMLNPYYQQSMYGWPGWGLGANRGGIMQKLQGGGDFLEDLVAQEDPMMEDPTGRTLAGVLAGDDTMMDDPTGRTLEGILDEEEGIPPEILEGIVNQRDPLMQKIMQMIMDMISPTLPEEAEIPLMGPSGMGEMGDYIGPMSEIGEEEQGDLGMMGGGTYAYDNGGYHDMYMDYKNDPTNDFDGTYEEFMEHILPMLDFSPTDNLATGGDYTLGAHVMGPGTGTSDSINAKLSDGEFVMTANAVKNLGGGDRYAGARKMYQMMNSLDPRSARPGEEPEMV